MTFDAPPDLRAVLAAIGDTSTVATELVAGLDESALRRATPDVPSCRELLLGLIATGNELGQVAHDVLGHVPGASDAAYARATEANGEQLLTQLRFLRAHIVSTVDQQGAAVWATPTPAGRPLFDYAIDLQRQDTAMLATLARAASAARQG